MRDFIYQNHPWLLFSVIVLVVMLLGEPGASQMQFQRQAIIDGEWYRLITTHFVHTNIFHTLLNLVGLILIGLLSTYHMASRDWWIGVLISAIFISIGLMVFDPQVQWYRGLSGVLHGILVLLVLKARQLAGFVRTIILAGMAIKILFEQLQLGFWSSEQLLGAPVIVNAHFYGVAGGLLSYFVLHQTRTKRMFRENF